MKIPKVSNQGIGEEVNGLLHFFAEGTGIVQGDTIDWDLTFGVGSRKSMVIVTVGDIDSNQAVVDRIYESIRQR